MTTLTPAEFFAAALGHVYEAHIADGSAVDPSTDALVMVQELTKAGWVIVAPARAREAEDPAMAAVSLGIKMREAQRAYFKSRTSANLIASKNAEKAFDDACGRALGDLFEKRHTGPL